MPPRKKAAKKKDDWEDEEVLSDSLSGSDDDEAPVQTKKRKKAPTPRKTAAEKNPWPSEEDDVDAKGWTIPAGRFLIWKDFGAAPSAKIAAFDLDQTLVIPKSGATFPTGPEDWIWWNASVPVKLKELSDSGCKIAVFTNQGSIQGAYTGKAAVKVKGRCELIAAALAKLGIKLQVFIAPSRNDPEYRKPGTGMWHFMAEHANGGVAPNLAECFFVGDAEGGKDSFSSSDRDFADGVGIEFFVSKDYFGDVERPAGAPGAAGKATGPNAELIEQLRDLAEEVKNTDKGPFKAAALKKAAQALQGWQGGEQKIEAGDLKAVLKLPGVGKGTITKIEAYLECGNVRGAEAVMRSADRSAQANRTHAQAARANAAALPFM